jgi:hypothetical protein
MSILRRIDCYLLAILFLLATAHRLPAPIQEVTETPTPIPEQSPKIEQLPSVSTAWPGEVFPQTRTQLLRVEDITAWDAEKVRYAINEMYARGGYDFRMPEIKQIFMRLSWYRERLVNGRTQDEAYAHLSALERKNLELLQAARRGKQ